MSRQHPASPGPTTEAHALYASGLYGRALRSLEKLGPLKNFSVDDRVLRVELLSLTGAIDKAISAAQELLKERRLTVSDRCKLFDALGVSYFRKGKHRTGVDAYEQGIKFAETHGAHTDACRLRVSLFRNKVTWIGPYQAAAEVNQLRRRIRQAADPRLSTRFQVGLVELAAKLGLYRKARRHLKTANELLSTIDDPSLRAIVELTDVALTAEEGDLGRSLQLALRFVETTNEVGSVSVSFALVVNLAHLLTAQARYSEALVWIQKGLTQMYGVAIEIPLRDTLMLLHVCKGDFDDAAAEAKKIQELLEDSVEGDSFYGLWNVVTRVKWLYGIGNAHQGLDEAQTALSRVRKMADRNLEERLQLFIAEGLALTGRIDEAADLLAATVISNSNPTFETIAEAARVRGVVIAAADPSAATKHFERAALIFRGIGHLANESKVRRELSQLKTAVHSLSTFDEAERLALAIDVSSHPGLLGTVLLSFIEASEAIIHARLVETTDGESRTVQSINSGLDVHKPKKRIVIVLGAETADYTIEIEPAETPQARMAMLAVEKLARAALAVDRARQMEKEQAVVWPEPVVEEELGLISASERTADLIKTIRRVAGSNLTILFTGETGVGKELFARALHLASPRKERTFLPFNCTGVPKDMFESQLFGHRRGAFTGAHEEGLGVIRAAAGGTLFLDEIGEMSLEVQPKLLRFLESGEIHPVGEPKPQKVDVRVVAATNKDLEQLVREGKFREDLYYRLNVLPIHIPPLRERREEIPSLVQHFLEIFGRDMQKPMLRVADETLEYLLLYPWPGNVRQLANELRRIVALTEPGEMLTPSHLSKDIIASRRTIPVPSSEVVIGLDQPLQDATDQLERAAIDRAMTAANGNNDDAAKALGLSRKGLYLKRQRLGLK